MGYNSNNNNYNSNIISNNISRTKGNDALNSNIEAVKIISNMIKTTLGPMGMDKMLIDSMGESIITNDGVKILSEMEIEHPGAKLLVEVAKTQEKEVGDGTTSAVIFTSALLEQAQNLISKKIHPTSIIRLFKQSSQEAINILEKNSIKVNINKDNLVEDICETAMTGKIGDLAKKNLSKLISEAINIINLKNINTNNNLINLINITKVIGGNIEDSFLIPGIILPKELSNSNMPTKINQAKTLLIDFPLEVQELDMNTKVNINSVSEYEQFMVSEKNYLKSLVTKIKQIGANVIFCQKGIDDNISYYLAKENIMAIRRIRKSDLEKLSNLLNIPIISNSEDLVKKNLGISNLIKQEQILNHTYIFVEGNSKTDSNIISLVLKSSTSHVLDEVTRAVEDALGDINSLVQSKKIVAGGGAIEIELFKQLTNYSKQFEGKNKIIIENFAKAFLSIPKTLINNSGFDEIDYIAKLIYKHDNNFSKSGLNGFLGIVEDTMKLGIVEPINVKSQIIKSAVETSSMILRIDDIIASKRLNEHY